LLQRGEVAIEFARQDFDERRLSLGAGGENDQNE